MNRVRTDPLGSHPVAVGRTRAALSDNGESPGHREGSDLGFQMVAGVGFEPTTFGL